MPSIPGIDFTPFIQTLLPVFPPAVSQIFLPFFIAGLTDIHSVYPPVFLSEKYPHSFSTVRNEVRSFSDNRQIIFHNSYNIFSDLFCSFFCLPILQYRQTLSTKTYAVHRYLLISILYKQDSALCSGNYWPYIII